MTSWTPTDEQVEAAKLAAIQRSDGDEDSWDADIRAALQGAGELIRREVAASLRSAYATRLAALGEEQAVTETRCPTCGIPVTGWQREGGDRVSMLPCGCWVTTAQALPAMRARGDA